MNTRIMLFVALMLLAASMIHASDVANFTNLGFSADGKYFLFGQYGVTKGDADPYGDLYLINVPSNSFVLDGVFQYRSERSIESGADGLGALFTAYADAATIVRRYNIDHINTGRLIYLLVDRENPSSQIDFRDFETGDRYIAILNQKSNDDGSAFLIEFTRELPSGVERQYRVGLPNYYRQNVLYYRIGRIIISENEDSLVFVIERDESIGGETGIRYMVETLSLK